MTAPRYIPGIALSLFLLPAYATASMNSNTAGRGPDKILLGLMLFAGGLIALNFPLFVYNLVGTRRKWRFSLVLCISLFVALVCGSIVSHCLQGGGITSRFGITATLLSISHFLMAAWSFRSIKAYEKEHSAMISNGHKHNQYKENSRTIAGDDDQ